MTDMSAPGWYPDPDGSPRLRYFDGRQWTANTADQPGPTTPGFQQQGSRHPGQQAGYQQQGPPAGFPPNTGPHGAEPPAADRNHLWGWVALAVVIALIIGLGTWLLFFRGSPVTPTPSPTITSPADPTPDPTIVDPAPSQEPTDDPTGQPSVVVADPSQGVDPPAALPVEPGALIQPLTDCPATASDAIGEQGPGGRYTSGAGLSMPAADGYTASPVQYPWVHQSNSQIKKYGTSWMSAVTVGTVRQEDGFTETGATAVAMVACMLGSDFYAGAEPVGSVGTIERAPDQDVVAMTVNVLVQGQPDITNELVYVMTVNTGGVMHVVIATVPTNDEAGTAAVGDVVRDVRLS